MRNIRTYLDYVTRRIGWMFYYLFPSALANKEIGESIYEWRGVTAFIPHADDEILGLWKSITSSEVTLLYFALTGSNKEKANKEIRDVEFNKFCSVVGCKCQWFDNMTDESMYSLLTASKAVAMPSLIDWHQEHRKMNFICLDYCERFDIKPSIIWYNISVPCPETEQVLYSHLTRKELRKKYKTFQQYYPSQSNIPIFRFKTKERCYGAECGSYAAEKFVLMRYDEWKSKIEKLEKLDMTDQTDALFKRINNLKEIARESKVIYTLLK